VLSLIAPCEDFAEGISGVLDKMNC